MAILNILPNTFCHSWVASTYLPLLRYSIALTARLCAVSEDLDEDNEIFDDFKTQCNDEEE